MENLVLVTGGCGFVGSHVVDALVEAGRDVRVLDLLHPLSHDRAPEYLNPAAEYLFGDVQDAALVEQALEGAGAVSHQAAMVGLGSSFDDVEDFVRNNDVGTAVLLRALARRAFAGRFVLASSMVVYGEGRYRCERHGVVALAPREPTRLEQGLFEPCCPECATELVPEPVPEDAPLRPASVYAATKLHQEHLCAAFERVCGVPTVLLRYHNVYGPRMPRDTPYAGVASIFRSALERGDSSVVFEDGGQLRDFVHVDDVARANVLALEPDARAGAFNVASGAPRSVGDLARALAAAYGSDDEPIVSGDYRLGDVRHVFASSRKAATELGFEAEVDFAAGVAAFAHAPLRGDPVVTPR